MPNPLISVVVEGYNDSLSLGSALETVQSIATQDYPLDQVELLLVGTNVQAASWRKALAAEQRFFRIECIGATGSHYYQLKNLGSRRASGEILAFTDSDALPCAGWLRSIERGISEGADAVCGITLFRWETGGQRFPAMLTAAASISWGFIVDDPPRGFLSHNVAFRRQVFDAFQYREDLGRTCAGSFLFELVVQNRFNIRFQSGQRVNHTFGVCWWLTRLHVRFGYEVYLLRRLNDAGAHRWAKHLGVFEPLATSAWHVLLDIPQWFRFSQKLDLAVGKRLAYLPLVVLLSMGARTAEAIGMYGALYAPVRMRRFALSN